MLTIAAFGVPARGQDAPAIHAGYTRISGLPDDWSHHHAVYSNPGTEEDAIRAGRHEKWLRIVNDPRYILHQLKRDAPVRGPAAEDVDWAEYLSRAYKADWRKESGEGDRRGAQPGAGNTGHGSAIGKDWNQALGATTAPSNVAFPAKWNFSITSASCANDFVVYPTGQAGATGRASIVAYYNVYSGCGGTVPMPDWAYNTGGTATLSPIFSIDGKQLAFVQTSGITASLVLLRIPLTPPGTGTITSPATPSTASTAAGYFNGGAGCTAPCMFKIALSGNTNDTASNPYYDYGTDTLYVGDSAGKLHKFAPVFNGAPAEVTSSWPVQLARGATNDTNQTTSPVYDGTTGYVFVGSTGGGTGGYLYSVGSGNAGTTSGSIHGYSGQLDATFGLRDAPLVDSSAGKVYVFAGNDPSGNNGVFQFPVTFGTNTAGTEVTVGAGGTGTTAYQLDGTFDNTYYNSANGASPTGNLYMCSTGVPGTLYQIPITANTMGAAVAGPVLGGAVGAQTYYGRCSPLTEFFNSASITATGTVTFNTNPGGLFGWGGSGQQATIGTTTYKFVNTTPTAVNQVEVYTSSGTAGNNESRTAQNLRAAVDGDSSQCYGGSGCIHSGQTANSSVTATQASNIVTLTSNTAGLAGNFTLSSSNSTNVAVSGGNNGTSGTDYLFLSIFLGLPAGCTQADLHGCVMSFDITNPASFGTGLTPGGALDISSPTLAAPTGGFIIDNAVTTLVGASQIYFETQATGGSSPCTGICAVQDSQSAP